MPVCLIPSVEDARFYVIALMTYLIGIAGFAHIVAGSADAWLLVIAGQIGLWHVAAAYAAPVRLGNVVGGTLLFALISYAQVMREIRATIALSLERLARRVANRCHRTAPLVVKREETPIYRGAIFGFGSRFVTRQIAEPCSLKAPTVDPTLESECRPIHCERQSMATGAVKWFNSRKGYGFIQPGTAKAPPWRLGRNSAGTALHEATPVLLLEDGNGAA